MTLAMLRIEPPHKCYNWQDNSDTSRCGRYRSVNETYFDKFKIVLYKKTHGQRDTRTDRRVLGEFSCHSERDCFKFTLTFFQEAEKKFLLHLIFARVRTATSLGWF